MNDQPTPLADRPPLQRLWDLPVHASWLDPLAAKISDVVHRVEPAWLADLLHGSWLGHPLHPLLAQATVGAFGGSAVLDVLQVTGLVPDGEEDGVETASAALVATGLLTSGATIASGWTDWSDLHTAQKRIGLVHSTANYVASGLYGASLLQRWRGRPSRGRALGLLGFGVASVGAALGGHLSYRWAAGSNHAEEVPQRTPEGWHVVARLADLVESTPTRSAIGDVPVVVVRRGEDVHVLADTCSHLGGPLSDGEVRVERGEACIVCPWHGSTFALEDGGVVHGPATAPQPHFQVRVLADGRVEARLVTLPGAAAVPNPASAAAG